LEKVETVQAFWSVGVLGKEFFGVEQEQDDDHQGKSRADAHVDQTSNPFTSGVMGIKRMRKRGACVAKLKTAC